MMEAEPETRQCKAGDAVCFFTPMLHFGPLNERESDRAVLFIPFEGQDTINYDHQSFLWDIVGLGWGHGPQRYSAMNACCKPTTNPLLHFPDEKDRDEISLGMQAATKPGGLCPFVPYSANGWVKVPHFLSLSVHEQAAAARVTAEEILLGLGLFIGHKLRFVGHGETLVRGQVSIVLVLKPWSIPQIAKEKKKSYKRGDLFLGDETGPLGPPGSFYIFRYSE
jgi:hypothetical protein